DATPPASATDPAGNRDGGQLFGVAHGVEVGDLAVDDLDADHALEPVAEVEHQRGRVVVERRLGAALGPGEADQPDDQLGDVVGTGHRAPGRADLSVAVGGPHHIGCQHRHQPLDITGGRG